MLLLFAKSRQTETFGRRRRRTSSVAWPSTRVFYRNNGRGKQWVATIILKGNPYHLGYYDEEDAAAVAYATAVVKYRKQRNKANDKAR